LRVHWKKDIRVVTTRLLSCCKSLMCSVNFKSSPIVLFITNQEKPIKRFFLVNNHLICLDGSLSKKTRKRSPSKVIKTLVPNQFLKLQKWNIQTQLVPLWNESQISRTGSYFKIKELP
jgi:hypothetical protein